MFPKRLDQKAETTSTGLAWNGTFDVLAQVKDVVSVPVAVKLSPYFSSTADMAHRLDEAGADGLVLFNRFMAPDIDPESLTMDHQIRLSTPAEARRADTAATTNWP